MVLPIGEAEVRTRVNTKLRTDSLIGRDVVEVILLLKGWVIRQSVLALNSAHLEQDLSCGVAHVKLIEGSDLLAEIQTRVREQHFTRNTTPRCRTPQGKAMVHTSAVGLGSLSVGLSPGALANALTGFGIVANPALAGVATVCGLVSVGFAAVSKRLNRKVAKHEKIYTLALAKRNSVNELVSQVLADKQISDVEFRIITGEVEKYHTLKAEIRAGGGQPAVTPDVATQTQAPDLEKLKEEIRKEVKIEFKQR